MTPPEGNEELITEELIAEFVAAVDTLASHPWEPFFAAMQFRYEHGRLVNSRPNRAGHLKGCAMISPEGTYSAEYTQLKMRILTAINTLSNFPLALETCSLVREIKRRNIRLTSADVDRALHYVEEFTWEWAGWQDGMP